MTQAFTHLRITDGTVTADLVDGVNYQLVAGGWSPGVATLRTGLLVGGRSPYERIDDTIVVNVFGTTGEIALANLEKLAQLIEQAQRWYDGDPDADPVRLEVAPQGSIVSDSGDELHSAILGYGRNGSEGLRLPVSFNDQLMIYEIADVELNFERDGEFLLPSEALTAVTEATSNNPGVMSSTWTEDPIHFSPYDVRVTVSNIGATLMPSGGSTGFIITAPSEDHIDLLEAEDATVQDNGGFGTWTNPADADASGGNVAQLVPTSANGTTDEAYLEFSGGDFNAGTDGKRFGFFAVVENNSSSLTYRLRIAEAGVVSLVDGSDVSGDEAITIPVNSGKVAVFISVVNAPFGGMNEFKLYIRPSGSGGSGHELWIDTIAVVNIDDPSVQVHWLKAQFRDSFMSLTPSDAVIRSGRMTGAVRRRPFVGGDIDAVLDEIPGTYRGDGFLRQRGDTTAVLVLMTSAEGGSSWWTVTSDTGTKRSIGMVVTRADARLTPR